MHDVLNILLLSRKWWGRVHPTLFSVRNTFMLLGNTIRKNKLFETKVLDVCERVFVSTMVTIMRRFWKFERGMRVGPTWGGLLFKITHTPNQNVQLFPFIVNNIISKKKSWMSLIWPIPPLPMLCWCWNHWNHFHLFLVFLVTRHLSCTNLIIRTIIYHHISMLSYSHILSYSHSLIFPHVPRYSDTISHRHLSRPLLVKRWVRGRSLSLLPGMEGRRVLHST